MPLLTVDKFGDIISFISPDLTKDSVCPRILYLFYINPISTLYLSIPKSLRSQDLRFESNSISTNIQPAYSRQVSINIYIYIISTIIQSISPHKAPYEVSSKPLPETSLPSYHRSSIHWFPPQHR
jgi:hypothetical protein